MFGFIKLLSTNSNTNALFSNSDTILSLFLFTFANRRKFVYLLQVTFMYIPFIYSNPIKKYLFTSFIFCSIK